MDDSGSYVECVQRVSVTQSLCVGLLRSRLTKTVNLGKGFSLPCCLNSQSSWLITNCEMVIGL